MKRRGNRRYYQHHEVLMIRRIRDLLYDQGFTISGARNKLQELVQSERERRRATLDLLDGADAMDDGIDLGDADQEVTPDWVTEFEFRATEEGMQVLRKELVQIRDLLSETV
jgi:hypothetical protein